MANQKIDAHIGGRVKALREAWQPPLSLDDLAAQLGIDAKLLDEYENGTRRFDIGHLDRCAVILGVPISYFFLDAPRPDGN